MDKNLARLYKNRWQEIEAVELREMQQATVEQRWRQVNAIYGLAQAMGTLPPVQDCLTDPAFQRWVQLKSRL